VNISIVSVDLPQKPLLIDECNVLADKVLSRD
jgi:hypothetical protein